MRIRVLVSFNGLVIGEELEVAFSEVALGWTKAGLVEVIDDGEAEAGPGEYPAVDPAGVDERAAERGTADGEQGEDPLPG